MIFLLFYCRIFTFTSILGKYNCQMLWNRYKGLSLKILIKIWIKDHGKIRINIVKHGQRCHSIFVRLRLREISSLQTISQPFCRQRKLLSFPLLQRNQLENYWNQLRSNLIITRSAESMHWRIRLLWQRIIVILFFRSVAKIKQWTVPVEYDNWRVQTIIYCKLNESSE